MGALRAKRRREPRDNPAAEAVGRRGMMEAERELMRRIREACGREIEAATNGDLTRAALLAAITANESGGSGSAYRFEPLIYSRLQCLLQGEEQEVEGVKREQIEKILRGVKSEFERAALLRKVAGRHGYTQIPGWCAVLWDAPLEDLTRKATHFGLALRRLEELCNCFRLDPERDALDVGRAWSTGHPMGQTRSALYSWRLGLRRSLWEEMGSRA